MVSLDSPYASAGWKMDGIAKVQQRTELDPIKLHWTLRVENVSDYEPTEEDEFHGYLDEKHVLQIYLQLLDEKESDELGTDWYENVRCDLIHHAVDVG